MKVCLNAETNPNIDEFDDGELDELKLDHCVDVYAKFNDRQKYITDAYRKVKLDGTFIISGLDYRWLVFSANFGDIKCDEFNKHISNIVSVDSMDNIVALLKSMNAKIITKRYNTFYYYVECVRT